MTKSTNRIRNKSFNNAKNYVSGLENLDPSVWREWFLFYFKIESAKNPHVLMESLRGQNKKMDLLDDFQKVSNERNFKRMVRELKKAKKEIEKLLSSPEVKNTCGISLKAALKKVSDKLSICSIYESGALKISKGAPSFPESLCLILLYAMENYSKEEFNVIDYLDLNFSKTLDPLIMKNEAYRIYKLSQTFSENYRDRIKKLKFTLRRRVDSKKSLNKLIHLYKEFQEYNDLSKEEKRLRLTQLESSPFRGWYLQFKSILKSREHDPRNFEFIESE